MKHLILLASVAFLALGIQAQKNVRPVSDAGQPYAVAAKNITIGNMAYSQKVLQAWKSYDNNTLDDAAGMFADDVVATLPDGTAIRGKDNVLKAFKDYRGTFSNVSSEVDACVTLKTPDDPEHEVVSIWGTESDTKDGSTSKVHLNEVWFFNKDGKVTELHQMAAKDTK